MMTHTEYAYKRLIEDRASAEYIEKATTEEAYKKLAEHACWYCWSLWRDTQYKAPETILQVTARIKEYKEKNV